MSQVSIIGSRGCVYQTAWIEQKRTSCVVGSWWFRHLFR